MCIRDRYKGHPGVLVGEIVESLVLREGLLENPSYHVILSLGGDGTHQEILNTLVDLPGNVLERILVFRLPMGTGNDGADVATLASAAKCLLGEGKIEEASALRIQPKGLRTIYAFNIASLGIDAFVTYTANRLKTRFNTDIYRKIADLSVIFYPFLFPTQPLGLDITCWDGRREQVSGRYVLAAFGVSGHRSYGNHKWILPGEENLCAITDRSFRKKLQLKNLLYAGKHVNQEGVLVRKAQQVRFHYDSSLYLQYDGEAIRLEQDNFPCQMELISTRIRTLKESSI
ncbi:MAG: diacylglycerol kinase family protein, partial [Spirochaetes bacterium]|nr:diacylglycerol kinase family protein [Spirochaetota bacterium]